jgi:cyclopropane-fatty-acyl-phospholipid synthase
MWLLDRLLRRLIRNGSLQITNADGRVYDYGQPSQNPIRLTFTDKRTANHIARYPSLGAGRPICAAGWSSSARMTFAIWC